MGACVGKQVAAPEHLVGRWTSGEDVSAGYRICVASAQYKISLRESRHNMGRHTGIIVEISQTGYLRYFNQEGLTAKVYSGPITDWGLAFPNAPIVGCCPSCTCGGGNRFEIDNYRKMDHSSWQVGDPPLELDSFRINGQQVHRVIE
mmetsp:Transcript_9684/g.19033  ORF Transcript_9684/g.19033 Transcript_9684/m.19033 type:complete len:147 (-) Transcript_9684:200-640(-)